MKAYTLPILAIVFAALLLGGLTWGSQKFIGVGADIVSPIAGQTYTLAGSGMSSSDTSFTLTSLTITQTGYPIQDSDMSDTFYITLEPGSRSRQEIIGCTTVGTNTGSEVTISGCSRGLSPITPYTASTTLAFAHSGGSTVIFSDPPQLFNQAAFKDNDEVVTGSWLFPTPLGDYNAATKAYVDSLVNGGTVSNDRLVVAGTAGETLSTSTLVYFNPSTQRWNGVSSASTTTFDDRFIGLTQGAGTNGVAVTNGILLKGRHTLSTGLTPGALYYAATATGTMSVSTSSQTLGVAVSASVMYFDPIWIDVPTENGDNTFTGSNTFTGTTTFSGAIVGATKIDVFTASSTWSKPTNAKYVEVIVVGAGGGGSGGAYNSTDSAGGAGGQGGGLSVYKFNASSLTSTVAVTVGTSGTGGAGGVAGGGGAGGSSGTDGGSSSFGAYLIATGGDQGDGGVISSSVGGSGEGIGNIANGSAGGSGVSDSSGNAGTAVLNFAPTGGGSGGGVSAGTTGRAGAAGGARTTVAALAGGTAGAANSGVGGTGNSFSTIDGIGGTGGGGGGGDDGDNANGGAGGAGGFPGGGGGGGGSSGSLSLSGGIGGAGANGIVVVITY